MNFCAVLFLAFEENKVIITRNGTYYISESKIKPVLVALFTKLEKIIKWKVVFTVRCGQVRVNLVV